jgi:hypothetical protein
MQYLENAFSLFIFSLIINLNHLGHKDIKKKYNNAKNIIKKRKKTPVWAHNVKKWKNEEMKK